MDPFNLFWKTVAGLEKVMNYPVRTEWEPNTQSGYMIVGGDTYAVRASPALNGIRVEQGTGGYRDIDKAHDHFMIADAMEFILGGLA